MIKKIVITCILFLNSMLLWSQSEGVSIGKGRVAAHEKSILELVSDSKGLLIPRLTTSEREAMFVMEDLSANGLMVYDNQESKFYFWDGSKWNNIGSGEQSLIYGTTLPAVIDYKQGHMFFDETTKSLYVNNLTEWVAVNNSQDELQNLSHVLSLGTSAGSLRIQDLADPVNEQDAVTKKYVDTHSVSIINNLVSTNTAEALSANQGQVLKGLIDVNTAKVGITSGQATAITSNKTGVAANLSSKVDKVSGKELSANDFTDVLKTKLEGAEITSNKNIANGYVGLNANTKIDVSHLPSITINDVHTVVSLAAQNALTPNQGDVAIRTDESKNYIYDGTVWVLLASPSVQVSSVNGKTGVVNLELGDIATLQTNLNSKVDKLTGKELSANDFTDVLKTRLDGAELTSNKNIANGYVGLNANTKIDVSHLPSITINEVYTVVSLAAQNALTPNQGDVAIRTDESKNYIYDGTVWVLLASPSVDVSSVNGKTGVVNLELGDIATLQISLDSKVDKLTGKELSANDFTDVLKTKLDGLAGTTVTDNVSSNSSTDALSANQGLILKGLIDVNTAKTGVHATAITSITSDIGTNVTAIALNTAKTGISTAQTNEIAFNTLKVSYPGDQDISGIVTNASNIATNTSDISTLQTEQTTQNTAIALNTAKIGISTAQTNEIAFNTLKVSYPGDQDISGIVTNASNIATNTSDISTLQTEQTTQNTAIALNTAKTGITTAQTNEIASNTLKVSYPGDQDISGIVTNVSNIATNASALASKVNKIAGKELSANDYTNAEKTKLAGLSNSTVTDNLTSTSTTEALSANQGNVLENTKLTKTGKRLF